jgi:hypothetical protein
MKTIWNKLSPLSRYYIITGIVFVVLWSLMSLLPIDFIDILFFTTTYIWHFTLAAPGMREKVMTTSHRMSLISVVVRVNYYLQLFIRSEKIPYRASLIRAFSPFLFILFLKVIGGRGNVLFGLMSSLIFEATYLYSDKKNHFQGSLFTAPIATSPEAPETTPVNPPAEKSLE